MIESILVATDASPAANRALALAIDMSLKHAATLEIIYVVRDMQVPAELRKMVEVEEMADARGEILMFIANQVLSDASSRAEKKGVKAVRTHVGKGDPAGAIINHAKRRKCDLVILGTRGMGNVRGLLLGSVSRKVVNLCKVNCLIVH